MRTTPGVGIPYREGTDPATVAADNEAAYRVIDAKLVELFGLVKGLAAEVAKPAPPPPPPPPAPRGAVSASHMGDGTWSVTGDAATVTVTAGPDGDWRIE